MESKELRNWQKRLASYISSRCKCPYSEAEEAAQDIFIKIWDKLDHIKDLEDYLLKAAKHFSIDYWRAHKDDPEFIPFQDEFTWVGDHEEDDGKTGANHKEDNEKRGDWEENPDFFDIPEHAPQPLSKETKELHEKVIGALTSRQREIMEMRFQANLTIEEIAKKLSISKNTVEATIGQARKKILKKFPISEHLIKYEGKLVKVTRVPEGMSGKELKRHRRKAEEVGKS